MPPVSEWFHVELDDEKVTLDVRPPEAEGWTASFRWADIERVCFEGADLMGTDTVYVWVKGRPESYVIPAEGDGQALWQEIIGRGLFDAQLAIEAAFGTGLRCWPPS